MSSEFDRQLGDATDRAWNASVAVLTELTDEEVDFDRIEDAAHELLSAARKGQHAEVRREAAR